MIKYQNFIVNARLKKNVFVPFAGNDHEHCVMCGVKFSEDINDLQEGYVTLEGQHWVCPECLHDYMKEYFWTLAITILRDGGFMLTSEASHMSLMC